ncbi:MULTISPECIES: YfhO family protein [Lactobacillus]|uniref:ABC transporter permease n=1 Tax=Lactobacillus xujianguonis TaxID=2495899 RepID=A0A437SSY6_9LACO|nr:MULTISPECIES: YfhO family protein [Lactobacillus]RVU70066.1 ABC transporter permease [Lactobacillus xujianguonis]RVU77645.1 ABC transporter permease [Lactobacillus xujianguonis]
MLSKLKTNLTKPSVYFGLISTILPFLLFFLYFASHHFNILTVDLGQQYVDFFAFLRSKLFSDPLSLIYTFQNGLGGSMVATTAYYLLSPFNLIVFLFPQSALPIAILTIISLKIAAIGLTSYYYWQKSVKPAYASAGGLAFALSGYVIANHFNLMWLDSLILLPLLIASIDHALKEEKDHLILITFALWVTNFYTGVMALFFGLLYFLVNFFIQKKQWQVFGHYLRRSILGSLLAAFVLVPVFFELLAGKTTAETDWSWSWQFNPVKELAKLTDGAYSFNEMQDGMPNIFMTLPFLTLVPVFFLDRKISIKERFSNGILLFFLLLSLVWTPLVLVWHLGQFPVWYPGRFSFVVVFYCLNLGMLVLKSQSDFSWPRKIIIGLLVLMTICYWTFKQNDFGFLNETCLLTSAAFAVLGLLFIFFLFPHFQFGRYYLWVIVALEVTVNLIFSLDNLSYQKNRDYQNFAANTTQATSFIQQQDPSLYRMEKSFFRSDDDAFTGNYYGLENFNSVTNQKVLNLLALLGYENNSNSVTNNGGTPITDAILGFKYYLEPNYTNDSLPKSQRLPFENLNHRLDLDLYPQIKEEPQLLIAKNANALPLAFLSPTKDLKAQFFGDNPAVNQEQLLQEVTGKKELVFQPLPWPQAKLTGVSTWSHNPHQYTAKKGAKKSQVSFVLKTSHPGSYYLEMPHGLQSEQVTLLVNGQDINLDVRDSQAHLINLGHFHHQTNLELTFILKNSTLNLSTANLWLLKTKQLTQILHAFKGQQPSVKQTSPLTLTTNSFTTKQKMRFNSTIPASPNWLIFDNGHLVKKRIFVKAFLSCSLPAGKHQIKLIYVPWALLLGLIISLLTLTYVKIQIH